MDIFQEIFSMIASMATIIVAILAVNDFVMQVYRRNKRKREEREKR